MATKTNEQKLQDLAAISKMAAKLKDWVEMLCREQGDGVPDAMLALHDALQPIEHLINGEGGMCYVIESSDEGWGDE